jgi:hypothetical protein
MVRLPGPQTPESVFEKGQALSLRGSGSLTGDGQQPTGKAGERFKVACGCQPPRSFRIRAQ